MKKFKIALLSLSVLMAAQSFGQKSSKKADASAVAFGIKAGINVANQTYKSQGLTISPSSLLGVTGGLFATIPVGDGGFGIQPELLYSMMGSKFDFTNGGTTVSSQEELGYLFMGKSNFPDSDPRVRYIKMKGRKVYEYAVKHVPQAMKECLDKSGIKDQREL